MRFKTDPVISLPNLVTAQLTGVKTEKVELCDLNLVDIKCAQCMTRFQPGDKIIALLDTEFGQDTVTLDEQLRIVHILNKEGHNCMEDYVARLNTKYATIQQPPVQNVEKVVPDPPPPTEK